MLLLRDLFCVRKKKKLPLRDITGAESIKNFRMLCRRINLLNQNFSHYEFMKWSTAILCRIIAGSKTNPVARHVGGTYVTNT